MRGLVTLGRKPSCMNIMGRTAKLWCRNDLHSLPHPKLLLLSVAPRSSYMISWVLGRRSSTGSAVQKDRSAAKVPTLF